MHTRDLENHGNLNMPMKSPWSLGETSADASRHAWLAIEALAIGALLGIAGAIANALSLR